MAESSVPPVSNEVMQALLVQLLEFRKLTPWRWMADSAISAHIDPAGQPWFACIMGAAGQVFGLCLYRGAAGLRAQRLITETAAAGLDPMVHRYEQDAITVWFGPKSDLERAERKRYEELGYAPKRGERNTWPEVRSHRPGYSPWHADEDEVRALIAALPSVLRFAEYFREHPDCYEEHGSWDIPTVPFGDAAVSSETLEWRTWPTPAGEPTAPPVLIDLSTPVFRRVAALPQSQESLEVDWFYLPEPVAGDGRPFFARCLVVLEERGGYCHGMDLIQPQDDLAAKAVAVIVAGIEKRSARPARILISKAELAQRLQPLASALDAEIRQVSRLRAVGEMRRALDAHARLGG